MIEELEKIRIPRNKMAGMQLLSKLASSGHVHWCSDVVAQTNLKKFSEKVLKTYPVSRTVHGRTYDRKKGKASVHFVLLPLGDKLIRWYLVSSTGKGGLVDSRRKPLAKVYDTTKKGEHLKFLHYEMLRLQKQLKNSNIELTWTWRLQRDDYKGREAEIVRLVKSKRTKQLQDHLLRLRKLPMFAGVRQQVFRLERESKKILGKFDSPTLKMFDFNKRLPVLRFKIFYDKSPTTLYDLIETPGKWHGRYHLSSVANEAWG